MTAWVTQPDAAITTKVETTEMTATGTTMGRSTSQLAIRPTPAGMNITGMISIRKCPVPRTDSSGTIPVHRPMSIRIRP